MSWMMTWDDQVVPVLQAHVFPAVQSVPIGMDPEWAQGTGNASHLSLPPWDAQCHLQVCPCAPSWEQAWLMGTRTMGTRELTPALRKLVSMTLLYILLVLMNCIK